MLPAAASGCSSTAATRIRVTSNAPPTTAIAEPSTCATSTIDCECGAGSARYHQDELSSGCQIVAGDSGLSVLRTSADATCAATASPAPTPRIEQATRREPT